MARENRRGRQDRHPRDSNHRERDRRRKPERKDSHRGREVRDRAALEMTIKRLEEQRQELKEKVKRLTALAKKMIKSHNRLGANFLEASISAEPELIERAEGARLANNFARHVIGRAFRAAETLVGIELDWFA